MNMPSRLIFFGTESFSIPTLQALIEHGFNVVGVVTKPDAAKGRGQKMYSNPIKRCAEENNIPVLQPPRLKDAIDSIKNLKPTAAILVSYGKIIPQQVLDLFAPIGIINIHPSLLPRYRGPSPIEATILAGDSETGISIMQLDAGMDTGPIFIQEQYPLNGTETNQSLSGALAEEGANLLVEHLSHILDGSLSPTPQNKSDVSVTSLISKTDGVLDPSTDDARTIERKVRAYQGFPKPHLILQGNDVVVTSSKITDSASDDDLTVTCANNTQLKITTLIAPSGRSMTGRDFMRGYMNQKKS